jgi:SCP-2 sterol transfer family
VAKYQFLSDEWFAIIDQLVEEHGADAPGSTDILMNLTVTDTPFGAERHLHMGAKQGRGHWGIGHADGADLQLTTDYGTAKEVFVSGDPAAGMQAFMSGKVKIQGDMAKLMAAQASGAAPGGATALQAAIQGITE